MTSLAASLSVDQRGPCALYIITDSRITWGKTSAQRWDAGQKAFASRTTPDVFGYCGDAFFPPVVIRQILEQVESGLILGRCDDADTRHSRMAGMMQATVATQVATPIEKFSVFHGARDGGGMQSRFRLWQISYSAATQRWVDKEYDIIGDRSYLVHIDGTGRNMIENSARTWDGTGAEGTSRAAVWSFCEALDRGADPFSGGAPQIVGIWRKGVGHNFGMIWKGKRFLSGLEVKEEAAWDRVDWFNDRFERCSGETGVLLDRAQSQPKPLRLVGEK